MKKKRTGDGTGSAAAGGGGKKPVFSPEFLAQLEPSNQDIRKMQRKLIYMISGCGTLIIAGILLAVYVPYLEYDSKLKRLSETYIEVLAAGKMEEARLLTPTPEAEIRRLSGIVQGLLAGGGTYKLESLDGGDGAAAHIPGTFFTAAGDTYPFRIEVGTDLEENGFIARMYFTDRQPPEPVRPGESEESGEPESEEADDDDDEAGDDGDGEDGAADADASPSESEGEGS